MRRRDFLSALIGASAALGSRASVGIAQPTAVPVIGFIDSSSPEVFRREVALLTASWCREYCGIHPLSPSPGGAAAARQRWQCSTP